MLQNYLKKKNQAIVIEISSDEEPEANKQPVAYIAQAQRQKCKEETERDPILKFTPSKVPLTQERPAQQRENRQEQQQKSPLPEYVHQMQIQESSNEYIYEQQWQLYPQKDKPASKQSVHQNQSQKQIIQSEKRQPDSSKIARKDPSAKCSLEVRRILLRNMIASMVAKKVAIQ